MSTVTEHFTDKDFAYALRVGVPRDVVIRQVIRQAKETRKLELAAARTDATAIYFPRATMTRTQRVVRWIKKVVR